MKIIGKTDTGFIVTATEDELCKIMGHRWTSALKENDKPAVGKEIKVSPLWEALEVSRARKTDIEALANGLRKIAGRVDYINQTLASPIVEVEVKA